MIIVEKTFYKAVEKKTYNKGDKADFGEKENQRIVDLGLAKKVVKKTKERKQPIKKK